MQLVWNLLPLALALALLPQLTPCQQTAKLMDPTLNSACPPPVGSCGRGVSYAPSGEQCCPSCANYMANCSAGCLKMNFSSSPCYSTCGDGGCRRSRCGEPVDGGSQCCDVSLVKGCASASKVYANSDCCPVCYTGSGAMPVSPQQCRFNATRGMGQPTCDTLGNCRLAAVSDRRDDANFDFGSILQVCSQADLAPLMDLLRWGPFSVLDLVGSGGGGSGSGSGSGSDSKPSMPGNTSSPMSSNMSGPFNSTMPIMSGSGSGSGSGGPDMKDLLPSLPNLIRNFSKLEAAAQGITTLACRDPMICMAKIMAQVGGVLETILGPIASAVAQISASGTPPAGITMPDVSGAISNAGQRIADALRGSASCMTLMQTQGACVIKSQSINMDELIRNSRCDMRSPANFLTLTKLAAKVADDASKNIPPGLNTLATLNCTDVRNPCVVDLVNNLIDRTAAGCVDANLVNAARDRMRRMLLDCTGGPQNLSQADMASALAGCQLTADDVQKIAATAPAMLQAVMLDTTPQTGGAAVTGLSMSSMVQDKLMNNCPSIKAAVDKALAQVMNLSNLSISDVIQMINVIRVDQLSRINQTTVWLKMSAADLATLNTKLASDSDRASKCQEIVRMVNQSLLASLPACIDKIPTDKLRSLFGSGPELTLAAQSFNITNMKPNDVARSTSVLRDMLSGVTATADNCLTYMNSLFSFPKDNINPSLCLNDTCYKQMCNTMSDHPNTVYCRSLRPRPSVSDMVNLGAKVMTQLTQGEIMTSLASTTDVSSFQSLVSNFADTGSSSSSASTSDFAARLDSSKKKCVMGAVMQKFQETFLTGTGLSNFSASSVDSSILCQMNSEQLKRLPCSQMATVAVKAATYIGSVNRGSGRAVIDCLCQMYSSCATITSAALSQISNYALFLNETEVAKLPENALSTYCQSMQSVSISEKSKKMSIALQRLVHVKCVSRVDMSSVGGSNATDVSGIAEWNSTIVKALPVCAITIEQVSKLNQEAAEYVVSILPTCPFNETWLLAVCTRLFKVYNDIATSGNYSMSTIGMCAVHLGIANTTKVSRDDVRTNCGAVSTAFRQNSDACYSRATNGLMGDCAASYDAAAAAAYKAALNVLDSGNPTVSGRRRRKRATTSLSCSDIQNLASGVAQVSAAQIQAMILSEFQTCFSTFGLTNANWSSDQCTQLKTQTEAAYNTTNLWTSSVMLTVGCLTQCWSSSDIAKIPYSDVAHISDIGKYCSLMSTQTKLAVVSNYINRVKSNNSALMTRTELSSLGNLECGADPSYVDSFNTSNVLNSLTELGTPGPCDPTVMQSFVNRLKLALGSTVSSWSASYFTSLANLISGLGDSDIPTLTTSQIGYVDASVIPGMTTSKFRTFTAAQLATFSASQRSAVTAAQLAVLSPSQKSALGYTTSAAGTLTTGTLLSIGCLAIASFGRQFQA